MRRYGPVLGLLFVFVLPGCGSSDTAPKLYPVTGSVAYKGGTPLTGGTVQFAPTNDTAYSVTGAIGDDGTFTLYTLRGKEKQLGAPEAEYHVTIQLPIPSDHRAVPPIVLSEPFRVKAGENHIPLEVPDKR